MGLGSPSFRRYATLKGIRNPAGGEGEGCTDCSTQKARTGAIRWTKTVFRNIYLWLANTTRRQVNESINLGWLHLWTAGEVQDCKDQEGPLILNLRAIGAHLIPLGTTVGNRSAHSSLPDQTLYVCFCLTCKKIGLHIPPRDPNSPNEM